MIKLEELAEGVWPLCRALLRGSAPGVAGAFSAGDEWALLPDFWSELVTDEDREANHSLSDIGRREVSTRGWEPRAGDARRTFVLWFIVSSDVVSI